MQESGKAVHQESFALASYGDKKKNFKRNDARDFWRFNDIPVVAWLLMLELISLISARFCFGDGVV